MMMRLLTVMVLLVGTSAYAQEAPAPAAPTPVAAAPAPTPAVAPRPATAPTPVGGQVPQDAAQAPPPGAAAQQPQDPCAEAPPSGISIMGVDPAQSTTGCDLDSALQAVMQMTQQAVFRQSALRRLQNKFDAKKKEADELNVTLAATTKKLAETEAASLEKSKQLGEKTSLLATAQAKLAACPTASTPTPSK